MFFCISAAGIVPQPPSIFHHTPRAAPQSPSVSHQPPHIAVAAPPPATAPVSHQPPHTAVAASRPASAPVACLSLMCLWYFSGRHCPTTAIHLSPHATSRSAIAPSFRNRRISQSPRPLPQSPSAFRHAPHTAIAARRPSSAPVACLSLMCFLHFSGRHCPTTAIHLSPHAASPPATAPVFHQPPHTTVAASRPATSHSAHCALPQPRRSSSAQRKAPPHPTFVRRTALSSCVDLFALVVYDAADVHGV